MRSFIGDLQIVRATRDLPANTEMTFSYVPHTEPVEMNKSLSSNWGFQCNCAICVDDRETSEAVKVKRSKLVQSLENNAPIKEKQDIIKQINKTYRHPSSEVPRIDMWNVNVTFANDLSEYVEAGRLLKQIFAAFESIGYVI